MTELYNEPTYDELKEVLSNYLNPNSEEETTTTSNGTQTTTSEASEKTETPKKENVEDAFDQLFQS